MRILLDLLLGACVVCAGWGILGSARVVSQVRYQPTLRPSDFGLDPERIQLTTSDRVTIAGWLIPHPRPSGVLVLLHGYGASKEDLLDLARAFHEQGTFHLLLLDLRGHGDSGGSTITFGRREIEDLKAALDYLASRPELADLPVGCFGVSMGGAIAILAAAENSRIRAVATDSAYADLGETIARTQWLTYHMPRVPLGQMAIWGTEWRLGCSMGRLSPVSRVGRLSPRPVLIVHGSDDQGVPPSQARALFEAAGQPKELWVVEGAEHASSFYRQPEEYMRRMIRFFNEAFSRTP